MNKYGFFQTTPIHLIVNFSKYKARNIFKVGFQKNALK